MMTETRGTADVKQKKVKFKKKETKKLNRS